MQEKSAREREKSEICTYIDAVVEVERMIKREVNHHAHQAPILR